ncbi:flagellar hook-length control protein FliK [Planococcus donghaensis]|uniref:Flagellar hook-length control protein-like C-terminal domain-containing protein n=1 Tax=Planococcus donghaensis TaxID=414778 RepID=A0A1C7EKS4_9BACL|nr:flagellar hook-length control protein FliK [Planococcus donghaensis]ANU24584.1 hypothetical protein BCM40_15020 [Planococcus donghaensis]
MEALKPVSQQTISLSPKTSAGPVAPKAMFASLLDSLNAETAVPNASAEKASIEELITSLESFLASLEEVPVEEESAEQLEIQYAIFQLQEFQAENKQSGVIGISQADVKASGDSSEVVKLLEKIQETLQTLVGKSTVETDKPLVVNDLARITKQLDELIGMFEKPQSAIKAASLLKTMEQEIPIFSVTEENRLVKEIPKLVSELLEPVKDTPKLAVENKELVKESGAPEVKVAQEPPSQPLSMAADAGKSGATLSKAEAATQPVPVVRLPNLLEDLSGMLKNSMRMIESQEGTKMRVNIFPEHLGHLEILLTSTNGKLAAQIMASTPMAKEALELQLNQLRVSLIQQGVEVEKIEVLEQSSQQAFSQQQPREQQQFTQQQHGKTTRTNNSYFQSEDELVREARKPLSEGFMKVDYTV